MPERRLRVVLADDHVLILESLELTLKSDFDVVGTVSDGRALVEETTRLRPDLVLLDMNLPLRNGIEAARQIVRAVPETKVVFLTQHSAREYIQAAFRAGGRGYLLKDTIGSELLSALREIAAGSYYVSPRLLNPEIKSRFNPAKNPGELFGNGITYIQQKILVALHSGKNEEEIARELRVSAAKVQSEIEELCADWSAQTKNDLIRYGVSAGLIPQ